MNVKSIYRCSSCSTEHAEYSEAKDCCAPRITEYFICGVCGERYRSGYLANAKKCCKAKVARALAERELSVCLCGAIPTETDVRDSRVLGSLIRCRSCILSVAPEMLTADQIARAA